MAGVTQAEEGLAGRKQLDLREKDGQVVRVAHWGVRDLKKTPAAARAVGATVPLTLERFADHPELEAEFMRDALPVSEADLWTDDQP